MATRRPVHGASHVDTGVHGLPNKAGRARVVWTSLASTLDMKRHEEEDDADKNAVQALSWTRAGQATCVVTKANTCPERAFGMGPCPGGEVTPQEVESLTWKGMHGMEWLKVTSLGCDQPSVCAELGEAHLVK